MALQRLGPFELIRVLGRGGMGTVYEAREEGSSQHVAVKALSPAYSFDERFRNRFEAEIDALMMLDHPNIVRLLSYGQKDGNLFFAMELVDGSSLYEEQKQGQVFHWREIVDIARQACDGLRHAHDRGIIHRDMKPGNLMMTRDGTVKITDFGIAKTFGASQLTGEGNVLGTMDFMAPEQARGKAATSRSDIFSLGAVMYALLAGRPPFLKQTVDQTFEALLSPDGPKRLDKVASDIPAPLVQLIHRMMEKDPARRIATAQATGRQLNHVLEQIKQSPKEDTQVVGTESASADGENTQIVNSATGEREYGDTSIKREIRSDKTEQIELDSGNGTGSIETREEDQGPGGRHPDYFNEVTPQQRSKKTEIIANEPSSSPWPLLIALLVVLAIAAIGVYWSVIRVPSEEEMLAKIRGERGTPTHVMDEMERFLEHYPESEDADWVRQLHQTGIAKRYGNTLARRVSTLNPLTPAEQKFVEFHRLKDTDAPKALELINAFLSVYDSHQHLNARDAKAVEMAKRLKPHVQANAEEQISAVREQISAVLRDAERFRRQAASAEEPANAAKNLEMAREKLNSVIVLYGEENLPYADDLLQQAKKDLAELQDDHD